MKHASLFTGIGGFDLAAEWMGWENVFHCEWNEFAQRHLKYYWPKAISYGDITKTEFTIHRGKIDILTGGFPCQPYSTAGKRLGKEDDRHLWPEMLRAIREIQPTWIVGENVRGLTNWNGGLVFDEVQADLENEGYEVTPFLLPACAVNAPHRRDRIWFVAYSGNNGSHGSKNGQGHRKGNDSHTPGKKAAKQSAGRSGKANVADTESKGLQGQNWRGMEGAIQFTECVASNANGFGHTGKEHGKKKAGVYSENGQGYGWQDFPTQSPVCDGDDGLSSRLDGITFSKWRNESIKAGGNAVVPQVVLQIFKAIEAYQNQNL